MSGVDEVEVVGVEVVAAVSRDWIVAIWESVWSWGYVW